MRHMYEITPDLVRIMEYAADPETKWEDIADTVEMIEGEFIEKADGYCKVIRNAEGDVKDLDGQIKILKEEIDRLTARKKSIEGNITFLKNTFKAAMEATGQTKIKLTGFTVYTKKSSQTVVDNMFAIPNECLRFKDPEPDKDKIAKYIDEHGPVEWAHVQENTSLVIR